jgi:hypothetical protein
VARGKKDERVPRPDTTGAAGYEGKSSISASYKGVQVPYERDGPKTEPTNEQDEKGNNTKMTTRREGLRLEPGARVETDAENTVPKKRDPRCGAHQGSK